MGPIRRYDRQLRAAEYRGTQVNGKALSWPDKQSNEQVGSCYSISMSKWRLAGRAEQL